MMTELEDDDDFPNDFDGIDFDGIAGLQAPPASIHASEALVAPTAVASPVSSSTSYGADEMDSAFFAAVDELEARALGETIGGQGHLKSDTLGGHRRTDLGSESLLQSKFDDHFPKKGQGSHMVSKKGKEKVELQDDKTLRVVLAGYDSELTCPICCDLLVGAQLSNPCGHTCCGECGYQWLARNRYEYTCAVCRTNLYSQKPLLPNFAADNLVRQHLVALAKTGRPEWQEKGYRTVEWNKRLDSWKNIAAKEKAAAARQRWRPQHYYEVEEYFPVIDDDSEELIPHAMTRRSTTRSRR